MTLIEKYYSLRPQINDGDLILFRGTSIVSRTIQNCDHAYWNHVGVVVEKHGALFIVDANANGVQADRLSFRIQGYAKGKDEDFMVIHPTAVPLKKSIYMRKLLRRSDIKWIHYDFRNGIKELLNRKFGWNLKISMRDEHAICSSNDAEYAINIEIVTEEFKNLRIAFPQDYIRYMNKENVRIIC